MSAFVWNLQRCCKCHRQSTYAIRVNGAWLPACDEHRLQLLDTAAAKKDETAHRKRAPVGTWR